MYSALTGDAELLAAGEHFAQVALSRPPLHSWAQVHFTLRATWDCEETRWSSA